MDAGGRTGPGCRRRGRGTPSRIRQEGTNTNGIAGAATDAGDLVAGGDPEARSATDAGDGRDQTVGGMVMAKQNAEGWQGVKAWSAGEQASGWTQKEQAAECRAGGWQMDVDGRGWTWMDVDGRGWTWMDVDGRGWTWMDVDGRGWTWMDVDGRGWMTRVDWDERRASAVSGGSPLTKGSASNCRDHSAKARSDGMKITRQIQPCPRRQDPLAATSGTKQRGDISTGSTTTSDRTSLRPCVPA